MHATAELCTTTIGLDLGDLSTTLCRLDAGGAVVERATLPTTAPALRERLGDIPRARVALEATTHSPWISRLLTELGHEVIVAHPVAAARLADRLRKTDRRDAESLARTARLDPQLLSPVQHRSEQQQHDHALIVARGHLVAERARLVHFVRGTVKASGGRIRGLTTSTFGRKALEQIPQGLRPGLVGVLAVLNELSRQIAQHDRLIETIGKERYPQTELLRQVDGVGPITALAYVLTVQDPSRFTRGKVAGYLGLVPRRLQSGERDPQLPITRAGDRLTRRLLVQCGHHILGPFGKDCDLRRWGLTIAARGGRGARQRAAVAVARRLAGLLWALWKTGAVYQPQRNPV